MQFECQQRTQNIRTTRIKAPNTHSLHVQVSSLLSPSLPSNSSPTITSPRQKVVGVKLKKLIQKVRLGWRSFLKLRLDSRLAVISKSFVHADRNGHTSSRFGHRGRVQWRLRCHAVSQWKAGERVAASA